VAMTAVSSVKVAAMESGEVGRSAVCVGGIVRGRGRCLGLPLR
jgi:hypothetical protein